MVFCDLRGFTAFADTAEPEEVMDILHQYHTVTNLAARLCAEARGGQILVSQRVFVEVQELVHAEPQGELTFKGFRQPMPVFNVVGLKDGESNL